MVQTILHPSARVRIAIVGKYTELTDSYTSIREALVHGGIPHDVGVDLEWITSARFEAEDPAELLAAYDGLLIPGGFGERGVEGMIDAVRVAREQGMPFFGICLGMQTAIIEFAHGAQVDPCIGHDAVDIEADQLDAPRDCWVYHRSLHQLRCGGLP